MIVAAALCPAPPLLARELTGADPVLPELRRACLDAVAALVGTDPDLVAVVAAWTQSREWPETAQLDLSPYAPALRQHEAAATEYLPLPLGLAGRLLDQAGYRGRRDMHSVSDIASAEECVALGGQLAAASVRLALLVMADGSARRSLKAPGYLDERSMPFDAAVERAIRSGDLAALLSMDAGLARELMATGRPALQVLAGAVRGLPLVSQVRYCDDPFGVAYLVASLTAA